MNRRHPQIKKFAFYGFLKNLKFFEPFILLYLVSLDISLYHIGLLYALRELIIYLFEIPSGVIADRYGKKLELIICFTFYIISFILFFIGKPIIFIVLAMIFYALGEAFRSGTHKAMIMIFLDKNKITTSKSQVYGYTRSYSLIGSAISSLVAIILIYLLPATRYIFLVTIIPYIANFYLITTYPDYMNEKIDTTFSIKTIFIEGYRNTKTLFREKKLLYYVLNSSLYEGLFRTSKDYIQVLVLTLVIGSGLSFSNQFTSDDLTYIILGVIYAVLYLVSAYASKNTHKLVATKSIDSVLNTLWLLMALSMIAIFIFSTINLIILVALFYLFSYVLINMRKPLIVEKLSEHMDKDKRATTLSIENQLRSIIILIFAPLIGLVADHLGVSYTFLFIGLLLLIAYPLIQIIRKRHQSY